MPGKGAFKRCVESVTRKGSADDPRAVCAAVGRKKYGPKKFAKMAAAGRRRAMKRKPAAAKRKKAHARNVRGMTKNEKAIFQAGQRMALAHVAPAAMLLGNKGKKRKRNPNGGDPAAAAAYKEFHGREADRISKFKSVHHLPKYTAALGDLTELKIRIPKGRVEGGRVVTLSDFDGAWLTRHPRLKQLYVEGGDQSLDLSEFGLDPADERERVFLGELTRCMYFTRKDHLGSDGGTANYHHKFGKNELTLEKTELVQVSYHVPDEQLEFSGGTFEIPAEGIDG
jgi:hypothetical protein